MALLKSVLFMENGGKMELERAEQWLE